MKEQKSDVPVVQTMPTFKDLFPDDDSENFEYLPELKLKGLDDQVGLLHTSGAFRYFGPQSAFMVIVGSRFRLIPKANRFYESRLALLLAIPVAWRP